MIKCSFIDFSSITDWVDETETTDLLYFWLKKSHKRKNTNYNPEYINRLREAVMVEPPALPYPKT